MTTEKVDGGKAVNTVSRTLRHCIGLLSVFFTFAVLNPVSANCDYYRQSIPRLVSETQSLTSATLYLEGLLAAKVSNNTNQRLSSLFTMPLDNKQWLASTITQLEKQLNGLREPLALSDEIAVCGDQGVEWLNINNQRRVAESDLLKQKIRFLNQPPAVVVMLARQIDHWEQIVAVAESLEASLDKRDQNANSQLDVQLVKEWIKRYQAALESWLILFIKKNNHFPEVDSLWISILSLKRIDDGIDLTYLAQLRPDIHRSITRLNEFQSSLTNAVSQWRNQTLLNQGWLTFLTQLTTPQVFFDGLYKEINRAPNNILSHLGRPFVKAYRLSRQQETSLTLLLIWVSQLLALSFLFFVLVKIAGEAASALARLQQGLISKLENPTLHYLSSGFFWVLKPNASWLFILIAANLVGSTIQDTWQIIGFIAPVGTVYAAFRALRVTIEWGMSRTFTRSGLFLSSNTEQQLVQDSRKMAWVALSCLLLWWLAYATGGGYLVYLISLVDIAIVWIACVWLLTKYQQAVDTFVTTVLGQEATGDTSKRGFVFRWALKTAWPLIFLLAHLVDSVASINQKLMVFDAYRSFSVKLLRVRLESRSEEEPEGEDAEPEPDENYSDWMLRKASEDLLFDVGDVSAALAPMKRWLADKTDENVTVVVGESGSGKSTFVKRLPNFWKDTPVNILDVNTKLTDPQTFLDQLAGLLEIKVFSDASGLVKQDANITPQVVVIDSAHNLFLAEVGYLNAYRSLMECMNAHLANVYWIIVFNAPSWSYLSDVFAREQRVSNLYKMPRWSPMDIRRLILSRHKGGRRRLKYNNMLLSAAASSESSSIRAANSRVFNILWEQSGGNPLAAIELWLNAVKVKGRTAEVGVPERPSANLLTGMKDDLYFIYTAIVLHASLSTREIMLVTHFSESIVRHAVKQGINMGMIIRDKSKRYRIDPYWYGSLSGFLHRKNMLWN
ncbi:MAG: hypothetical protein CSA50_05235 [Gammaproteobacteria bacterium]|nr:MAG: hypothetical protein CSA50_05235 [Gammaproteobacteria bacterium]